jgi:uroporphyrinogen-III synthase
MRPLAGIPVFVTGALPRARELASLLEAEGARPILAPLIEIAAPEDPAPLHDALQRLDTYHWIILTSANAVDRAATGPCPPNLQVAAIGPATAAALLQAGWPVHIQAADAVAEGLLDAFASVPLRNARVLYPRAQEARELLAAELQRRGALLDLVPAYRTLPVPALPLPLRDHHGPAWVTLASGSAARALVRTAPEPLIRAWRLASIGPATSQVLRQSGFEPAVEADPHTYPGIVAAIRSATLKP